ncbi:MAG: Verru_Chthon cassette protein B [Chthoniobacter sp.]|nr:Verru_Chthon cassette protein B [Chthoniobacter sp.]
MSRLPLTLFNEPSRIKVRYGMRSVATKLAAGFSLVEVVLAIGVIAFAFVGIFALLPTGMSISRQAMDTSVGSQIAQRVINDALQSDFPELLKNAAGATISGTNETGRKAERYFDDQGSELPASSKAQAIYHVNTRITPATAMPKTGTSSGGDNTNLAIVTVQVANNPGNRELALSTDPSNSQDKPLRNLWTGAYASDRNNTKAVPCLTFPALVARNK